MRTWAHYLACRAGEAKNPSILLARQRTHYRYAPPTMPQTLTNCKKSAQAQSTVTFAKGHML
ncbi:MAG: hypothetical protein BCS36_06355 [Desulfovibrio sp. MES5]|nr:MAG: hypothetical protein BCS36_06355 [Desulfovibrio sp. MES5]